MNQPNAVSTALVEIRKNLMSPEMKKRLAAVLGGKIDVDRFSQVAMVAISKNTDLTLADRASLFTSCMECAADGLLPNGKDAALVVFNTNVGTQAKPEWKKLVQYLPMVRGIYKVAERTGTVRMFNARVVHQQDEFHREYGFEPVLRHVPAAADPGKAIGAYSVLIKTDGTRDFEYMTRDEIEVVRGRAKSSNSPAWQHHYEEMMKKVVIHRHAKRLDLTPELEQVVNRIEQDYDFDNSDFDDAPAKVGDGKAPRAEDFAKAEPEPEPEDYELFDEVGELVGSHTARVWVEQFQAIIQNFGNAKSAKRLEAAWIANETTRERLAGEGMDEYVTEVRTYYERWKAALAGTPVAEAKDARKDAPRQQRVKAASANPGPAAAPTEPIDDDTFPGDRPSANAPAAPEASDGDDEPAWIAVFRSRLPQVATEKALDSFEKATFGDPLGLLAKENPAKHKELMALVEARRKRIRADIPGGK